MLLIIGQDSMLGGAIAATATSRGIPWVGTSRRVGARWHLDLDEPAVRWTLPDEIKAAIICAAQTGLAACENDPVGTRSINVTATCTLADILTSRGSRVTFLSSNKVFNANDGAPEEDAVPAPDNDYGHQKLSVEHYLKECCPDSQIVRLTKVVSPLSPIFSAWANSLSLGDAISAYVDFYLSPLAINSAASAITQISSCPHSGVFHLSSSDSISYLDAARWMAARVGASPDLVQPSNAPTPNSPESCRLSYVRTQQLIGFTPSSSLQNLSDMHELIDEPTTKTREV